MGLASQVRCPRCQGRLVEATDQHGRYRSCLTCGYVDECCQGPAVVLLEPLSGSQRRRDPSHGHVTL
jgi:hypothetical protein